MAARKSRKSKKESPTPTEENEATQSAPEAAVADDTSTAPAEPAENHEGQSDPQPPAAKKRGITPSRPIANAQANEDVPPARADKPDLFRPVDIRHPVPGPGRGIYVTAMQNIRTGEIVHTPGVQALIDAQEE